MEDKYREAVALFESGNLKSAENLLQYLVAQDGGDYDVLNFLGVIYLNLGDFEKAAGYFESVVSLRPDHAQSIYNLALCRQRLGDFERAGNLYKNFLELLPGNADALNNLGVCRYKLEQYSDAEKYYSEALGAEPNNPMTFTNLGNLNLAMGCFDEAEKYYKKAAALVPGSDVNQFNLGSCYLKKGKPQIAIDCFKKAVELNPQNSGALNNMGIAFTDQGLYEEAKRVYKLILQQKPDNPETLFNLANCCQANGELEIASGLYEEVVKLDPDNKGAYVNLGNISALLGKQTESEYYFNKAVGQKEERAVAFTNLALRMLEKGSFDEAVRFIDIALKARPDLPEIHYNKSHILLLHGMFNEGWKEYEWRKKRKEFFSLKCSKPELSPEIRNIKDKRILVYDEQGFGDSIQFLRYLTLLKGKGAYVIFVCDPRISPLLKEFKWVDEIIDKTTPDEPDTDYDYYTPLLSLPLYFGTDLKSIPAEVPYLKPSRDSIEQWKNFIGTGDRLKIGIVWAGNPKHTGDAKRSCGINDFKILFELKGTEFYSLQKGEAVKQAASAPVKVLDENLESFYDTAAAIANLDLVISVDTSVAHLAGALGKPVWILLPQMPDWRWMLIREDTPWYPTMRLFRQSEEGNWAGVFHRLRKELETELDKKNKIDIDEFSDGNKIKSASASHEEIYLGFPSVQENYGWGVVCNNLRAGLTELTEFKSLDEHPDLQNNKNLNGTVFQLLKDLNFNQLYEARGKNNIGYTVFESELNDISVENSKKFDKVVAASSWCVEKMRFKGIGNTDLLIQGIDPKLYYPSGQIRNDNLFVIFSGGKFELRKSQDIVLRAVKILQDKYDDIVLMNAWYNLWPETIKSVANSPHINFELKGRTWEEIMYHLYTVNSIDPNRVITLPLIPGDQLRGIYLQSDVGLFPNRCEGGTNLVMMEYMACGKPVVGSYNSGQRDILTEKNSLPVMKMKDFQVYGDNGKLLMDWKEPDLDEVVAKIEYAYFHRDEIRKIGAKAAEDLQKYTWDKVAARMLKIIRS